MAKTDYKDWFNAGQLNNGTFPLVDFQKGTNLVSLKTVDTTGATWIKRMQAHIEDLDKSPMTVSDRSVNKILDIRVQPGGYEAVKSLIKFGEENNITVIIKEIGN